MTAKTSHCCSCDTKGAAWENGSDLQTQVRAVAFWRKHPSDVRCSAAYASAASSRAGVAQRIDLNHDNTSSDKWFQSLCAIRLLLYLMRSRRFCNSYSTSLQLRRFRKRISKIGLFFTILRSGMAVREAKDIPIFVYGISVKMLSFYDIARNGKRASPLRHGCSIVV